MKKKRLIIIIILTVMLSITILCLTKVYEKNYEKKIKEEKKIIKEIISSYKEFKKVDESTIDKRDGIYKKLENFYLYYDSMESNYDTAIKLYKEYEELVTKTDEKSTYLLDKCIDKEYMSSEVTTKCFAFTRNYEQTINVFVQDLELFNSKIDSYNEWTKENSGKKTLEKYSSSKYIKYIDIDNDGTYLGKTND